MDSKKLSISHIGATQDTKIYQGICLICGEHTDNREPCCGSDLMCEGMVIHPMNAETLEALEIYERTKA